jgi:hypothetical protein
MAANAEEEVRSNVICKVGEVAHMKNAKAKAATMFGRLSGVGAGSNTAAVGTFALASAVVIAAAALKNADLSASPAQQQYYDIIVIT